MTTQTEPCKYGQEPKSCTSSPMDCQCAIDAALAQPEQEPDAFDDAIEVIGHNEIRTRWRLEKGTKLYTTPPQRTWVGLTDREKSNLWLESRTAIPRFHTYASLVEAKLKEKNHERN